MLLVKPLASPFIVLHIFLSHNSLSPFLQPHVHVYTLSYLNLGMDHPGYSVDTIGDCGILFTNY